MSAPISNQQIAAALRQEGKSRKQAYAAAALLKAAAIIEKFKEPIVSADQLRGVAGIGDGTRKRVQSILQEGLGNYVPPAPTRPEPEVRVAAAAPVAVPVGYDFTQIKFFGKVADRTLHAHGILTLEQLETAVAEAQQRTDEAGTDPTQGLILPQGVGVTANQLAGLRYREHLALRVPREEVAEIGTTIIQEARNLNMVGQIVGSYRRGRADSGDIDVLLTGARNRLHDLVQRLWDLGIIRYTFSLGEVKGMFMAVRPSSLEESPNGEWDVPREVPRRSLDIRFVPTDTFGPAMLFATGPGEFNVLQRHVAKEKGWQLSEYGLIDANGKRLPAYTEEEVFTALGMDYLTPEEREQYASAAGAPRR